MTAFDRQSELAALTEQLLAERLTKREIPGDYGYDIGPGIVETPQGLQGGYVLVVSTKSPLLKPARLAYVGFIANGWPDEAELGKALDEALAAIALQRNRLLAVPDGPA